MNTMKYRDNVKRIFFRALGSFMVLSLFFLASCSKEIELDGLPFKKRTLFIYMAANNNLGGIASQNINWMKEAFSQRYYGDNRVVIYWAPNRTPSTPVLVEIKRNGPSARVDTLKVYEPQSAVEPATLQMAIEDMLDFAPADSYALILWSHGTGWMPADLPPGSGYTTVQPQQRAMYGEKIPQTRYFGEEAKKYMELSDLCGALPDHLFQFILFDACFMGQVEVAYALRNKADYLIASPAEVLFDGMPYNKIIQYIFTSTPQLEAICREFFNHYENQFATIGLYDLRQMEPLAEVMSQIIATYKNNIPSIPIAGIQYFDRYQKHTMFDLSNFVEKLMPESDPLWAQFERQMASTILYKDAIPKNTLHIPINTYCGISTYIPIAGYADLNDFYYRTDWYKRVYEEN